MSIYGVLADRKPTWGLPPDCVRCCPLVDLAGMLVLLGLLVSVCTGFRLEILRPENGSCVGPDAGVDCEVLLDEDETPESFASLHGHRRMCLHRGGPKPFVSCFDQSGGLVLQGLEPGCHSMFAVLEGREEKSVPVVFEAPKTQGGFCVGSAMCGLLHDAERSNELSMSLNIESPRSDDVVYGESVIVSVYMAVRNGTRVRQDGLLCLGYAPLLLDAQVGRGRQGRREEECVEVERHQYSEGVGLDVMVSSRGTHALRLDARFVDRKGREMRSKEAVDVAFESVNIVSERVLSDKLLDTHPGMLASLPLVLVLCHYEEDLSWLSSQPHPTIIYEKKAPLHSYGRHAVPYNVAGEATGFLKFITDYYNQLPERMLFLHSHRSAYHQEDILLVLRQLDAHGLNDIDYCNINKVVWGSKEDTDRKYLRLHWDEWLRRWLGDLPDVLLDRCCAQFVLHRDRVRTRPLEFYEEALERMYMCGGSREESRRCGLLMEWLWHYIFGEPALADEQLRPLIPLLPHADRLAISSRAECLRPMTPATWHTAVG